MEKKLKQYLEKGSFFNVSEKRSKTMSAIKGKSNKSTEISLQMALVRREISGWSRNERSLPGKPDFYFDKKKLAIFVDGCFWHGCPICGHIPKTRSDFWRAKIQRNQERDDKVRKELEASGIQVLRFWEHELKNKVSLNKIVNDIIEKLNGYD